MYIYIYIYLDGGEPDADRARQAEEAPAPPHSEKHAAHMLQACSLGSSPNPLGSPQVPRHRLL